MSGHPWLPLWCGDFITDTAHLSDAETGQYLLLLMCMWRNDGKLPDDPVKLARVARCKRVSGDVMSFFQRGDGTISQKRLTIELEKARAFSEKQRANINKRWHPNPLEKLDPTDTSECTKPIPSQSQSQLQKKREEADAFGVEFRDEFWQMFPNKVGKPNALRAFIAARKKADLATILGGLKLYIETRPADRPWLNPSTFLNQERWADKPACVNGHAHGANKPYVPRGPVKTWAEIKAERDGVK